MSLDNENLIDSTKIEKLIKDNCNMEKLNELSISFANAEPMATVLVTDRIDQALELVVDKDMNEDTLIKLEDVCWGMFLMGYEAGKITHSYNLEDIQ